MKDFKDMTEQEIQEMSKEDFDAVSPMDKKSCYDCACLKMAVTSWCGNKKAVESRGTSIAGCIRCAYWEPDWRYIDKKHKQINEV